MATPGAVMNDAALLSSQRNEANGKEAITAGLVCRCRNTKRPPPAVEPKRKRRLHQHRVADESHRETFNFKGLTGLNHDHRVVGVFRQQLDGCGGAAQAFDRDVVP